MLHTHLERLHKTEYLELCKANSWEMQLPKMKEIQVSAVRGDNVPCLQFSHSTFVQGLVRFIVADDQISKPPKRP